MLREMLFSRSFYFFFNSIVILFSTFCACTHHSFSQSRMNNKHESTNTKRALSFGFRRALIRSLFFQYTPITIHNRTAFCASVRTNNVVRFVIIVVIKRGKKKICIYFHQQQSAHTHDHLILSTI